MKRLILAAATIMMMTAAHAAPAELPAEMTGFWMPMHSDSNNDPGPMKRLSEWQYEWEVRQNEWIEWDGFCTIHSVKKLGEMDYEVGATCGLIDGSSKPTFKMDPNEPTTEEVYQFSMCGDTLNIRVLKDQPAQPQGCKIS